jgi:replication-associated recombination protein RarA
MVLQIHTNIMAKLKYFYEMHKIPNIIFHGSSGCGKRTIVNDFINIIYNNDKEKIKSYVMYVNCAHGKGIKFIREELKFFAKTHIHSNGGDIFKSIILLNADKLTIDAQSALRRCIELFSHTTRFFIIVEDKYKLLKPILSRFCEIYIPEPLQNGANLNLYKYNLNETFKLKTIKTQRMDWLKKELQKTFVENKSLKADVRPNFLIELSEKLYEKAYSGLDIIYLLENQPSQFLDLSIDKKYELLFAFNKVKKEFRNDKLLLMFILNFLFISLDFTLENITFM